MAHAVLSVISGVVGFNVIYALLSIICSIIIMGGGGKVELAESVKAWPRSIVARIKGTFIDAKDGIKGKLHDGKEAVVKRFKGEEGAPEDSDASEVSPDSDEFWGGAPNPNSTPEMRGKKSWHSMRGHLRRRSPYSRPQSQLKQRSPRLFQTFMRRSSGTESALADRRTCIRLKPILQCMQ